jgi:hypothetical protein
MKKTTLSLLLVLACVIALFGCPSGPIDVGVPEPADASPHKVGAFSPTIGASGTVQTSNGSGGLSGATNVSAGSSFVTIGATPASVGAVRLANAGEINALNVGGGADITIATVTSNNRLFLGVDASFGKTATDVYVFPSNSISLGVAGGNYIDFVGGALNLYKPVVGATGGNSPYGVHGIGTQAMADANQTPAASVYSYGAIKTTGALTANRNLVLPTVTDAGAYPKWINNTCTGAFSIVVQCSGPASTVSIANGKSAWIFFDSRGAIRMTPDT